MILTASVIAFASRAGEGNCPAVRPVPMPPDRPAGSVHL